VDGESLFDGLPASVDEEPDEPSDDDAFSFDAAPSFDDPDVSEVAAVFDSLAVDDSLAGLLSVL